MFALQATGNSHLVPVFLKKLDLSDLGIYKEIRVVMVFPLFSVCWAFGHLRKFFVSSKNWYKGHGLIHTGRFKQGNYL